MVQRRHPGSVSLPTDSSNRPRITPHWHSRGYLPHFECPGKVQHVTFHLHDSLPQAYLQKMIADFQQLPIEQQDEERRKRIQHWLDAGYGSCILRRPELAEMMQNTLLYFDADRYKLIAWVVMPNHVHTLFQPDDTWTVRKIVASWKKFSARKICDWKWEQSDDYGKTTRPEPDMVWHREYFDRYIRDERHLRNAIDYIHNNPVKAGLVRRAEDWRWSSAYTGNRYDG